MSRKINEYNYIIAYNYLREGAHHIITNDSEAEQSEIEGSIILPSPTNPESEILKRENYNELSDEAKEVIHIILNSPKEVIELFLTPTRKQMSKRMLKDALIKCWKSAFIVEQVFKEITKWVNNL